MDWLNGVEFRRVAGNEVSIYRKKKKKKLRFYNHRRYTAVSQYAVGSFTTLKNDHRHITLVIEADLLRERQARF